MEEKVRSVEMVGGETVAQKIFDSVVKNYDPFLTTTTFGFIDQWQNELINNVPSGELFVDIGTGTGEIVKKVNRVYPETKVVGIDVSMNMLRKAIEKTEGDPRDFFVRASALKMPFKDKSVDAVLSSLTFRHLPLDEAAKEINRVLKDGGYFGILDIVKPPSRKLYKAVNIFATKIFRPIGTSIFSKEEYEYFMESIEKALSPDALRVALSDYSFKQEYQVTKFFGMITISIFRKVQ